MIDVEASWRRFGKGGLYFSLWIAPVLVEVWVPGYRLEGFRWCRVTWPGLFRIVNLHVGNLLHVEVKVKELGKPPSTKEVGND